MKLKDKRPTEITKTGSEQQISKNVTQQDERTRKINEEKMELW